MIGLTGIPVFFSIYFYFAQISIEQEMEQALLFEPLQEVMIPTHEIVWLKNGKEILVKNQPFDVKSFKQHGNVTIFKGLCDKNEKELKIKLLAGNREKENNGRKQEQLLRIIFMSLYPQYLKPDINYFASDTRIYGAHHSIFIQDKFVAIITPPPRSLQANLFCN